MFDRLGRKDDETPFVVEWFVKNGIEVWSAVEGEQRFDNHVDKLLNYIRYWQASGESIKTSVRTKTRLEQLTESGCYTGGSIPYGYQLDKRGRLDKRNREVFDLVIDEDAAKIIQLIFDKYVFEGFGAQRLCRYLTEMNIRKPDGSNFPNTSINRIIKTLSIPALFVTERPDPMLSPNCKSLTRKSLSGRRKSWQTGQRTMRKRRST